MRVNSPDGNATGSAGSSPILIFGLARSGTTWLAKTFDSHPGTLYRHEPDIVLREGRLPMICPRADWPRHRDLARAYMLRLLDTATVKTVGPPPSFGKSFRGFPTHAFRTGAALALNGMTLTSGAATALQRIQIPDFIRSPTRSGVRTVLKSVSANGRVGLFAEALPEARIVFLIRHPCGQVASCLRGIALGKLRTPVNSASIAEITALDLAKAHGLTASGLADMDLVEQLSWYWALLNEMAITDLAGRAEGRLIRYEDVCANPFDRMREAFDFTGLDWASRTEAFLARSTTRKTRDRYYQIFKDSSATVHRWRETLPVTFQERIQDVVRLSPAWRYYD